ncbi:Pentatricopeptide repeat-containing protein [Quillaja saponaria]|uniref:Pentatricopeptide repeat-containing protein n=1 Tax=Quillaja saponaria TaxID=32244 RepID=A0AAD7L850_QUISA|nr:Pentatricopeptide repeat-containing protein [Quillaja saponaria]
MRRILCNKLQKHLGKHKQPLHSLLLKYTSTKFINWTNHATSIPLIEHHESWSRLIRMLAQDGTNIGLALFEASQLLGYGIKPNGYALVQLVRASTNLGLDPYGKQLHGYILRSGYYFDVFVSATLIRFYVRIESLNDAHILFDDMPHLNVVSWNTLISGYVHSGQFRRALCLFLQLERSHIYADAFSLTSALAACGQLSFLKLGRSIHSKVLKFGLERNIVVANCSIDMYGKCGSVQEAVQVFYEMIDKDTISWNSVISASASNGDIEQSLSFLYQMPNPDSISYNEVINGIALGGNIEDAIQILSNMPNPNSSSWNSIITGYVNRGRAREALSMVSEMHSKDIQMDLFTFSITLSGIASLSALMWGTLIHCCTIKCGLDASVLVGSALIDMYSKCGLVKTADLIFHSLSIKNLVSWNAMISGYAHNGYSAEVIHLFEQLKMERGVKPDGITFLNVLFACSHNQLQMEVVIQYLESMIKDYGIAPTIEHCCSMIRLMGQRGELWRAEMMIYNMGFESCGLVWRALLGACGTCRDLKVAETAAVKVIELEGNEDYVYVMMSNLYASYERWGDVGIIRKLMRERRVRKEVGCSWIEVGNYFSEKSIT